MVGILPLVWKRDLEGYHSSPFDAPRLFAEHVAFAMYSHRLVKDVESAYTTTGESTLGSSLVDCSSIMRYDVKKKRYEYKVLWAGCPASEASYVAEDKIDAKELMSEFDEKFPRGSVKTDSNEDKKLYLKANPGLLELKRTAATSPTSDKKTTNDTGDRRSTSRQGRRATKTYGDAPGGTSTRSTRGRVRRPPTRLELSLHDQRRLHDHLLYLFDNDIDHYEMAIHDWDHTVTHEVLRQDYDLDYTTGWDGDLNEHTYVPPDTLVANMRLYHIVVRPAPLTN